MLNVTPFASSLPGDFNSDGRVDSGDFVTWRKNSGTNNALADDGGLGTPVGAAHYDLWRSKFGDRSGSGSGSLAGELATVPQPGTFALTLVAAVGMWFWLNNPRWQQESGR